MKKKFTLIIVLLLQIYVKQGFCASDSPWPDMPQDLIIFLGPVCDGFSTFGQASLEIPLPNFLKWICQPLGRGYLGSIPSSINLLTQATLLDLTNTLGFITGSIPSELFLLPNLEFLYFQSKGLTGPIPTEIGRLDKLVALGMTNAGVSGPLPIELGDLESLQSLNFDNTMNTGEIPSELGSLAKLKEMNIHVAGIRGTLPALLGNLTSLTSLILDTGNSGGVPSEWGNLKALQTLVITGDYTEELPDTLGNLNELLSLSLTGRGNWNVSFPKFVSRLRSLEAWVMENGFQAPFSTNLGNLRELGYINFKKVGINGSFPQELLALTGLRDAIISEAGLSGELPENMFARWSSVSSLNLSNNGLTGKFPAGMNAETFSIDLSNNAYTAFPANLNHLSSLKDLVLNNNHIEGSFPSFILEGKLSNLYRLDLSFNQLNGPVPAIDDASSFFKYIHELYLSNNQLTGSFSLENFQVGSILKLDLSNNLLGPDLDLTAGPRERNRVDSLYLQGNNFDTEFPQGLYDYGFLYNLDLSNNSFYGTLPDWIPSRMIRLVKVDLSYNNFNGTIAPTIFDLTLLEEFYVKGNNFIGTMPFYDTTKVKSDVPPGFAFSVMPTNLPTYSPSFLPSISPTSAPSLNPTAKPVSDVRVDAPSFASTTVYAAVGSFVALSVSVAAVVCGLFVYQQQWPIENGKVSL